MDYEYYSVDPYDPLDPQRELDTVREVLALFSPAYQQADRAIENFFQPRIVVKHSRALFPLEARIFGDTVLTRCTMPADLEATLLRR